MVNISDIEMTLSYPAPIGKYVLYNVGNGWIVLNSMFFSDIHLKLAECDEKRKIVDPVIEKIIKPPVAWYQEKDIVLVGVPLIFIAGLISGVYITR